MLYLIEKHLVIISPAVNVRWYAFVQNLLDKFVSKLLCFHLSTLTLNNLDLYFAGIKYKL